jgi:hypothetical protein
MEEIDEVLSKYGVQIIQAGEKKLIYLIKQKSTAIR